MQALGRLGVKTGDAKIGDTLAQVLREDNAGVYRSAGVAARAVAGTPWGKAPASPRNTEPGTRSSATDLMIEYPLPRTAAQAVGALEKVGVLLPSYVTQAAKQAQFKVTSSPGKPPATAVPTRYPGCRLPEGC